MATLYIREYASVGRDLNSIDIQSGEEDGFVVDQTVAVGAEAKSSAFNAKTRFIRVHTDAICSILFGANPTATTSKARMAANTTEFFSIPASRPSGFKLSVIANT